MFIHRRTRFAPSHASRLPVYKPSTPSFTSPHPLLSALAASSLLAFCCSSFFIPLLPSSCFSLSLSLFFPPDILPSPAGTVCWLNIWEGGALGAGGPGEDQRRKGCSCCGLAACFIIIPLPACSGFAAHRASCKVRNHNFLKNV